MSALELPRPSRARPGCDEHPTGMPPDRWCGTCSAASGCGHGSDAVTRGGDCSDCLALEYVAAERVKITKLREALAKIMEIVGPKLPGFPALTAADGSLEEIGEIAERAISETEP